MEIGEVWLDLPADFVDEALLLASQSAPEALRRQFLDERDAVSSIEIVDIREESFRRLDSTWAVRLGIGDALRDLLIENGPSNGGISGCVVRRVLADAEEGARLDAGVLYLALRVDTFLSRARLREIVSGSFGGD
jgi:hypothetical protein